MSKPVARPVAGPTLARDLPRPSDQPAHTHAFDAFAGAVCADSSVAGLSTARQAVDRPGVSGEETLTYGGQSLIVDGRNLTAVMTRIRWRAMDRIHELISGGTAASDPAVKGYVQFLFGEVGGAIKDPASATNRLEHWYHVVSESVLAAVQQRVADAAGTSADTPGKADADAGRKKIGNRYDPTGEIDPKTGQHKLVDSGEQANWCGAFASLLYERGGGNAANSPALGGEGSLRSQFDYKPARKMLVDGQKVDVETYHSQRGSRRTVISFPDPITDPGAVDLQPGDIVLLDNARGLNPDHIQTCESYNRTTGVLTTVGGNEGTGKAEVTIVKRGSRTVPGQPAPNTADENTPKHVRVWGRARWSIVDFEPHVYPR
ncbi:MAG: hypothetical protein H0W96_01545 [Solirubrobacterales bacterium]|nr:hypothetical protein [Solirubrobacterales bacterium]